MTAAENIRQYLVSNGPTETKDLPHGVSTRIKIEMPDLRRITIQYGSKRKVAVWYLAGIHDETEVLETFLEDHPEFVEHFGARGAVGRLRAMGRSWGRAARKLVDIPHAGGSSKRKSAQDMIEEGLIPPPAHQEASE